VVAATNGVTASFIKELVRRAVLVAARERADTGDATAPEVTRVHVETAFEDLLHHGVAGPAVVPRSEPRVAQPARSLRAGRARPVRCRWVVRLRIAGLT